MALRLNALKTTDLSPRIVVFGVGGGGGNAVNNMIDDNLQGVDFVVANTDSQALARSKAERRIQIGLNTTQGLGAGANPQIGMAAAEESTNEIMEHLGDAHMVFITAGMGGGTGTGAAPTIARIARDMGILTVAVVTKPFHFEGPRRMAMAESGLAELQKNVDTLIVIPNQNLFRVANDKTTFQAAFQMADQVLHSGVRGVTDLMIMPGLINLDFADVKSVMSGMGKAMMGTGEAEGEGRAITAAQRAISNPLLEDVSLKGARSVLIHITGGPDMGLYEFDEAANQVRAEVDPNANIIVGSTFDENMEGKIRVSVVASGIEMDEALMPAPNTMNNTRAAVQTPTPAPQPQAINVVRVSPPRETLVETQAAPAAPVPEPSYSAPVQKPLEQDLYAEVPMEQEMPAAPQQSYARPPAQDVRPSPYVNNSGNNAYNPAPQNPAPQNTYNQNREAQVRETHEAHATPVEPGFGFINNLFGKPKPRQTAPNFETNHHADTQENNLFPEESVEDYSIPAFLRRQAN